MMADPEDQTRALIEDDETIVFDPDLELEWEVGPDMEIVFTPDNAQRQSAPRGARRCG